MRPSVASIALTIWFYALFLAVSAIAIPLLALSVVVCAPFLSHRRAMRLFRDRIKTYGRTVLALPRPFVRISYETTGAEAIPPLPCIYVCNHRSASDPFLLAFPPGEIVQVVNVWPFRLPVLGKFARWAGYLSIREMEPESFFDAAEKLLREGVSLGVFPEGTRSPSGKIGTFHGAAFRLALKTRTPIVPICLLGSEDKPRKGSPWISPGRIRVLRLPALQPEAFERDTPFRLKNRVRALLEAAAEEAEPIESAPESA